MINNPDLLPTATVWTYFGVIAGEQVGGDIILLDGADAFEIGMKAVFAALHNVSRVPISQMKASNYIVWRKKNEC